MWGDIGLYLFVWLHLSFFSGTLLPLPYGSGQLLTDSGEDGDKGSPRDGAVISAGDKAPTFQPRAWFMFFPAFLM